MNYHNIRKHNRDCFILALKKNAGFSTIEEAKNVVDVFCSTLQNELDAGRDVDIESLGVFGSMSRKVRIRYFYNNSHKQKYFKRMWVPIWTPVYWKASKTKEAIRKAFDVKKRNL